VALQKATSFEEAQDIYYLQKKTIAPSIPYFISVSNYFTKWDQDFASLVLSNIASLATTNVKALLTLAYSYEVQKDYINAHSVYEHILSLQPSRSQTYTEMARNLVTMERYQDGFELYNQILVNETPGVDFTGITEIAETEIKNLVAKHKSSITYQDLPNSLLEGNFKQDIRIVFEWTDPTAEFEIQFVNPQKKFFNFIHNKFDTNELLLDEISKGYSSEQFLIDDAESGFWVINTTYLGNETMKNPTYLKYILYRNYGLPTQTKTVKLIELFAHKKKVTIDRFLN
jgi:tetratricopeptide (TPR) repeat protein